MSLVTPLADFGAFAGWRSQAWYSEDVGTASVATAPVAADTAYAFPFFLPAPAIIDSLALLVGTPVPGTLARLALYASRPGAPLPGNLIVGVDTDLDCNAPANTALAVVLGTPAAAPRGIVWGVTKFNGAAQPRTPATSISPGSMASMAGRLLGAATPLGALGTGGAGDVRAVTAPAAFLAAWPGFLAGAAVAGSPPAAPSVAWRHL